MECNKDEALRAKTVAEQKMVVNDFEGARRIALKAKQLFPELDNISQLVTVCDIHCSAQKKIYGAEKDLYGILQVEKVADEATIRKQYRKLALVLHPDKNKFPGAEAAFKLVGEANMVLSDTGKRSVYDVKCSRVPARPAVTKLQNHQGHQASYTTKNNFKKVPGSQHGQSESNPNVRLSFWTYCPFCKVTYEYFREYINRPLRCQNCSKLFIAHDIGPQVAGTGSHYVPQNMKTANVKSNKVQPPVSQQKDIGRREPVKVNIQKDGKLPSHLAHQKTNVGGFSRSGMEHGELSKQKDNVQKPMETGTSKGTNKKRRRRMVVESTETSSDVEVTAFGGVDGDSGVDSVKRRKPSRKKRVSYQEDGAEESSPQKRSRMGTKEKVSTKPFHTADVAKYADVSKNMKTGIMNGEEAVKPDDHLGDPDPDFVMCPDSEFTNFDKDKEEHCFAVDQIWACYDSIDSMPRFYALVRKIFKSEFKLQITWLNPKPGINQEIKWAEAGLPVACGNFVLGETEEMNDCLSFSHQMIYKKGASRFSFVIQPQKGEIWAIYKDCDVFKWSLAKKSDEKYEFDIVEVLSVLEDGIYVAFLSKVKGFVCVFQRTVLPGLAADTIPFNERFRFSHRIKSVKLNGTERAGIPTGSFELDTASLPVEDDYYYLNKVSMEPAKNIDPPPEFDREKVKPTSLSKTAKKRTNGPDNKMLNVRRSPRGLAHQSNGVKEDKVNAAHSSISHEEKAKSTKGLTNNPKEHVGSGMLNPRRSPRELTQDRCNGVSEKFSDGQSSQSHENKLKPSCLSDTSNQLVSPDVLNLRQSRRVAMRGDQSIGAMNEVNDSQNPFLKGGDTDPISKKFTKSSASRKPVQISHDFSSDKHTWKFEVGQIWAFWENDNGIRQCYAQIKKVESDPVRLIVSPLKLCEIPSNDTIRHNACGLFKVYPSRTIMLELDSFSHNVKAEARGKGTFSIYPKEQQIWALYKKTGKKAGECSIVEVLEADESSIKVLLLTRVRGYKFVFKAPNIQRSTGKINVIPRIESNRFSHQIPAFHFTDETDGCLRGCWALDPAAFTGPPKPNQGVAVSCGETHSMNIDE
ncbi:uncharacterized protein [Rutidosis leptorrhynchoides]|uniref:uncharacterized protein n=1 Tax=Rutidosis leptorrhynchoides TaxID=125765 RepID=UPI003A9A256D